VLGQPVPQHGDDHEAGQQAEPEHRVAAQQQRLPELARGHVWHEQGPGGAGHRRDHRHEPAAEGALGRDVEPGEEPVRHGDGREEAQCGPGQPQDDVDGESGPDTEDVASREQGGRTEGK
jgi:hypothetical protein